MKNNSSGIYKIVNRDTGEIYIGQTVNFQKRWHGHRRWLERGGHGCAKLQAEWNRLGAEYFEFEVVELIPDAKAWDKQLLTRERHYVKLNPGCLGVHDPYARRELTSDQAREIRRRWANGERNKDLSEEFGVSNGLVSMICHRRRYTNVH